MKYLIINGPNLNMLGIREPAIYGQNSYEDLVSIIKMHAEKLGVSVEFFQSNHEGDLIDAVQKAYFDSVDGIVINPGGYTHTSIALADAIKSVAIPTVEVHISNINEREPFRKISFIRDVCVASICGEGFDGYTHALDVLLEKMS